MPFLWIDLEMTGLDEAKDSILEAAAVVTDIDFKVLEDFCRIVFQPPEVLEAMDAWCKKTHGESGLTAKVKNGSPLATVEADLLTVINRHFATTEQVVLCGNSVGNDRRFIDKYMPQVAKRLHYRQIDVSSFKEVFRQKYGIKVEKKGSHRALQDIQESIDELKVYLNYVRVN